MTTHDGTFDRITSEDIRVSLRSDKYDNVNNGGHAVLVMPPLKVVNYNII